MKNDGGNAKEHTFSDALLMEHSELLLLLPCFERSFDYDTAIHDYDTARFKAACYLSLVAAEAGDL